MENKQIYLKTVPAPPVFPEVAPTYLTDQTMAERKEKLQQRMKEEGFDTLIIYADKEHGSNFEYLTGFIPRFEEALLVFEADGSCTGILGNENLKMAAFSRIPLTLKHCPLFSLPNQPMEQGQMLEDIFSEIGLAKKRKVGLIGWKMFTISNQSTKQLFDLPAFIVEAVKTTLPESTLLENAAALFIQSSRGVRTTNNANEIAHYEYGANLASRCMLRALDAVVPGIKEAELGELLSAEGQYQSVVTIAATAQRFEHANLYPTYKKVRVGDPLSMTTGFKGGLSSRTGFVVASEDELPSEQKDYLDRVAKPYFKAAAVWLEKICIGLTGAELYQEIEQVFPKEQYGWHLNPGHLVADEEWMSSPVYEHSSEKITSGMIFQLDIIPSVSGYTGVSAEECVAVADENLQQTIKISYPELWERISARRKYLEEVLHITLNQAVLPLSNTVAYLRPFYLAKDQALCFE
ncbi:pepP/PepQ-like peptidase, M24 family protein [Listeria floridensis FSL S10-1187]|uniref:PepP/PepQ-like peptidase, M24 family protein n=1 Tax=Listeria floridensis FSL S10-1187 TaxID=1265817 RepID=A0ABN0RD22_9LIST|nr:aminopeptidase P family protein [Listeria floridensis]EUJ28210.1 pepP/PepQ-like peptidase, M24 family protein [Listeria floridensis FSL S10-1187]